VDSNKGASFGIGFHKFCLWMNLVLIVLCEAFLVYFYGKNDEWWFFLLPVLFFGLFSFIHYILMQGLKKESTFSRIGSIVYGVLIIFGFPLGTLFGIILIYSMTKNWRKPKENNIASDGVEW
jgi:hypothetical protein